MVEIAKMAAQKNGLEIFKHIHNYRITDQAALAEIAELAFQRPDFERELLRFPANALNLMANFGIKDQAALKIQGDLLERGEALPPERLQKAAEEAVGKMLVLQDEILGQLSALRSLEDRTDVANMLFKLFLEPTSRDLFIGLETVMPYHLPKARQPPF